jgi:hypothetical protein
MRIHRALKVLPLAALAAALLSGCSSPGAAPKACMTEANLVDVTGSTMPYRKQWPIELTQAAHDALLKGDRFLASTFTSGAGTVAWTVDANGCASPESRPHKHERWAAQQATTLAPALTALTTSRAKGASDPLGALEAAAKLPRLGVVRLWSDLMVTDDGVRLGRAITAKRLDGLATEWAARLSGLRGVRVVVLHAGRGARNDAAIRRGEELVRTAVERAGGTLELQPVITAGA